MLAGMADLHERLKQEAAAEARRARWQKLLILIVGVIVVGIIVYEVRQPQKQLTCTPVFAGQGGTGSSLTRFGSCS